MVELIAYQFLVCLQNFFPRGDAAGLAISIWEQLTTGRNTSSKHHSAENRHALSSSPLGVASIGIFNNNRHMDFNLTVPSPELLRCYMTSSTPATLNWPVDAHTHT